MQDFKEFIHTGGYNFEGIEDPFFLIGLLSAFDNHYQARADGFFGEISWKQFFAIICINLCRESPTINELSEVMGSSHQNVKQILLKLEKKGFVEMIADEKDRRKQRIVTIKKCEDFCQRNDQGSKIQMNKIFEGISQEQLITTIQTISQMERNLKK